MTKLQPDLAARTQCAADGLVAFVRVASPATLVGIAYGDSQAQAGHDERHLIALKEVVDAYDCRLNGRPDSSWFPSEPVELVSYCAGGNSSAAICTANALLLIADLEGGGYGHMDYRWEESPGEAFFRNLRPSVGTPLLAGIEVLMEVWTIEGSI